MNRLCLDTSAYSHFRRGDRPVVELIDGADWIGVPSTVLGELWTGFLLGGHFRRNENELMEFLAHPAVNELPIDRAAGRIYADIVTSLGKAGTPLPSNHIWIAAVAATVGATVLTYDSRFRAIHRVGSVVLRTPS